MKTALFILSIFVTLGISNLSYALRCGNEVVSEGLKTSEVLGKCGEPRFRNTEQKEWVQNIGQDLRKTYTPLEYWVYDFGPSKLVQILQFENDRLTKIQSAGYSPYEAKPELCQATPNPISMSTNRSQLLIQCGPPSSKTYQEEMLKQNDGSFLNSRLEFWTYQTEAKKPSRTFRFRDGNLDQITSP